jgi:hypothetical protein
MQEGGEVVYKLCDYDSVERFEGASAESKRNDAWNVTMLGCFGVLHNQRYEGLNQTRLWENDEIRSIVKELAESLGCPYGYSGSVVWLVLHHRDELNRRLAPAKLQFEKVDEDDFICSPDTLIRCLDAIETNDPDDMRRTVAYVLASITVE